MDMKKIYRISLLLICLIFTPSLLAATTIEQFAESQLAPLAKSKTSYGVVIVSADDGKILYQANPDLPLAPASNQKLVTTITALGTLGPDFEFTTTLAKTPIGDLVVIGDGDPGLGDPELCAPSPVVETFDRWAKALVAAGITQVTGKIIFDDTIFDRQFVHPNWPANQINHWYAAPVAGLNLNDNCLDLSVQFDANKKAQLITSPAMESLNIQPKWIPAKGQTIINANWENPQNLNVKIRYGGRPAGPVNVTIPDPILFFASVCRERLVAGGVTINGSIEFQQIRKPDGTLPENLTIIAQQKTPIMNVVLRANKSSQNFFAECLFKRIGYHYARQHDGFGSGTWPTGQLAVKNFFHEQFKSSLENVFVDDGSGLSKNNRISAKLITDLLLYAKNQPWFDKYLPTLAVAGTDGTLRHRMRNSPATGKVRAKTGYINGVSALSGYVLDAQNKPRVIFSMLFNFPPPSRKLWQVKTAEDRICTELAAMLASMPATQSTTEQQSGQGMANQ